jgi:hypothetical protein
MIRLNHKGGAKMKTAGRFYFYRNGKQIEPLAGVPVEGAGKWTHPGSNARTEIYTFGPDNRPKKITTEYFGNENEAVDIKEWWPNIAPVWFKLVAL